ncbi:hypothetical protein E2C01_012173 [Portunus trituberculatus]|uniref:Uncharacterized protein n=1 Tax=Portunus trituberculatus TaxID=210409 RepID=A0A5B7DCT7_PORTR|nr:hypothetical protein [Portunus trituberculatus]
MTAPAPSFSSPSPSLDWVVAPCSSCSTTTSSPGVTVPLFTGHFSLPSSSSSSRLQYSTLHEIVQQKYWSLLTVVGRAQVSSQISHHNGLTESQTIRSSKFQAQVLPAMS